MIAKNKSHRGVGALEIQFRCHCQQNVLNSLKIQGDADEQGSISIVSAIKVFGLRQQSKYYLDLRRLRNRHNDPTSTHRS